MKYIGTKKIEAEPMTLGEFIKMSGRDPYANCIDRHADEEPGYIVKYADGYVSWSPKEAFENAYRIADTYVDRMKIELQEVKERLMKLNEFLYSADHPKISQKEICRLNDQKRAMERYVGILLARIYDAQSPDKTDETEEIPCSGRPSDCECACGVGTC